MSFFWKIWFLGPDYEFSDFYPWSLLTDLNYLFLTSKFPAIGGDF